MTNNEQKEIFGENLRRIIEASGKQQQEIADALDIPKTTLNTWVVGKVIPQYSKLRRLAEYLGVAIVDLTEKTAPNSPEMDLHDKLMLEIHKRENRLNTEQLQRLIGYLDFMIESDMYLGKKDGD